LAENKLDGRLNFTITHEAGHISLHSSLSLGTSTKEIKNQIYCRNIDAYRVLSKEWQVEHQANHYATCLLLPRTQLFGLLDNSGTTDLEVMAKDLMSKFGVSRYALEYRLSKLGFRTVNNLYSFK